MLRGKASGKEDVTSCAKYAAPGRYSIYIFMLNCIKVNTIYAAMKCSLYPLLREIGRYAFLTDFFWLICIQVFIDFLQVDATLLRSAASVVSNVRYYRAYTTVQNMFKAATSVTDDLYALTGGGGGK